ncbi:MAG: hypothetical protein K9G26_02055 [Emcibacter sp.]|nr:hypothetical protein [Emcibacter sp.]
MTSNKKLFGAIATFLILATPSFATDLKNLDNVTYSIYIELDENEQILTINPNETLTDVCTLCYIGMEDSENGISIQYQTKVYIKNGQFTTEK